MRLIHGALENQRERIPAIDRRLALFQEQAGTPRMQRVQGLFVGIYDKHLASYILLFCPEGPPFTRVMLTSSTFVEGFTEHALG